MSSATSARRGGLALLASVCLALTACSSSGSNGASGSDSTSPGSSGSAAADLSFYKGKTLTMIVPSKPGGSFDSWGRLLAKWMGDHLHASIRVQNVPAGNTLVGQNTLAAARTDGLTFGWLNIPNDVELAATGSKGLRFDLTSLPIIGALPGSESGILVQAKTGYTSIADLQKSSKKISALSVSSGTNDLLLRTILGAYGVKARYITGYSNTADLAAGFLRGDGDVTSENTTSVVDPIRDGKMKAVVLERPADPKNALYPQLKDVSSVAQLLADNPPPTTAGKDALTALMDTVGDGQVLAMPKGTPQKYVSALAEAMKWSMQQSGLQAQAAKQSLVPGYDGGDVVHDKIIAALKNAPALKPYVVSAGD